MEVSLNWKCLLGVPMIRMIRFCCLHWGPFWKTTISKQASRRDVLSMLIHDRNSCANMNTSEPRSFKACKSMTAFTVYPKRNSAVGSTKMSTNSALLIAPPPDLSTAPCARCSENYADTSQLLVHFRAFLWLLSAWQPTEGAWNEHIAWPS